MRKITETKDGIDWILFGLVGIITLWGLSVLYSFGGESSGIFDRQLIMVGVAGIAMLLLSFIDYRFLRQSWVVMSIYITTVLILASLIVFGAVFSGARSWFDLGFFALQPAEFAKVVLILVLAKYFSKRHVEIASLKHIIVSGCYAFIFFLLIVIQPDLGSAVIIFAIWFGMVLLSGLNWRHLFLLLGAVVVGSVLMWTYIMPNYQKERIATYLNPTADVQGAGYNIRQATIAVGSGGVTGKGVGYGSQSRLQFLPQYHTDFVFAAFAEEWGFLGVIILLGLYVGVVGRIVLAGMYGETNFEMLFAGGVAIFIISHVLIHTGINLGLLPVTGTTIPFMSSGGSHLLAEGVALGMVFGMRRYRRTIERPRSGENEII